MSSRELFEGLKSLADELPNLTEAMIKAKLRKLDLVTREEFDIQSDLLAQAVARLETLEAELAKLNP